MLYIHKSIQCTTIASPELDIPDALFCSLQLSDNDECLLAVIYRPPNSPVDADSTLSDALRFALHNARSNVLILGDFNIPSLFTSSSNCHSFRESIMELMSCTPLYNHVHHPTRYRSAQTPSTLDLVLTNEELMIETINFSSPLGLSDHVVLSFEYTYFHKLENHTPTVQKIIDHDLLRSLFIANRWEFYDSWTAEANWENFYGQLCFLIGVASTLKTRITKHSLQKPIRSRTRKWMCRRDAAWFKYLENPTELHWSYYTLLRNRCVCFIRDDKQCFQRDLVRKFVKDPKALYKHVNQLRKVQVGIPPLTTCTGSVSLPKDCANIFRDQFASVVSTPDNQHETTPISSNIHIITQVDFTLLWCLGQYYYDQQSHKLNSQTSDEEVVLTN